MQQVFDKHYMLWCLKLMMNENLKEPKWGLSKKSQKIFRLRSFQKWAIDEILHEIKVSDEPPDMVISAWLSKVSQYATLNPANKEIFEIARDVGEMAEDIILGMM